MGPGTERKLPAKRINKAAARFKKERDQARIKLREIRRIIEAVDNRAMAADGPVTPTLKEMTQLEISRIYKLAGGKPGR